ncbi:MAG: hypothetical protein FWG03_08065 [Clostridiales bacterium]|nr:hypothetical protein [Clostridiales bacterium]
MKKIANILAAAIMLFLLAPALAAYADAIVEPQNDFFNKYRSECVYLGRSFSANGEDGQVPLKTAPGAGKEIATIKNGETIYFEYSCLYEGEFWGLSPGFEGWGELSQFLVLYDYIAFEEEHLGEFYPYEGDYGEIEKAGRAFAWPWPGADAPLWAIEDIELEYFWADCAWKDGQGREWGFFSYSRGGSDIWVCLSDPENRDIPAFNPEPAPAPWESETEHIDIGGQGSVPTTLIIVIVLVVAVALSTALLIRKFWKPNQTGKGENSNG